MHDNERRGRNQIKRESIEEENWIGHRDNNGLEGSDDGEENLEGRPGKAARESNQGDGLEGTSSPKWKQSSLGKIKDTFSQVARKKTS